MMRRDRAHLRLLEISRVIILAGVDCPVSRSEAFESGARGYIPIASTTVELAIAIIRLVRAGGNIGAPGQPVSARDPPSGCSPQAITTYGFPPCQMEKPNKIIAHELEVSESAFLAVKNSRLQASIPTLRSGLAIGRSVLAASRLQEKGCRRASRI